MPTVYLKDGTSYETISQTFGENARLQEYDKLIKAWVYDVITYKQLLRRYPPEAPNGPNELEYTILQLFWNIVDPLNLD